MCLHGLLVAGLLGPLGGCFEPHEDTAQGLDLHVSYGDHWDVTLGERAAQTMGATLRQSGPEGLEVTLPDGHTLVARNAEAGFTLHILYEFGPGDAIRRANASEAEALALERAPQLAPDFDDHARSFDEATGWHHQGEPNATCPCTRP